MGEDIGTWVSVLKWIAENPEKGSLALVLVVGAWRYLREARTDTKAVDARESFTETLIEENRKLREELLEERERSRRNRMANEANHGRENP